MSARKRAAAILGKSERQVKRLITAGKLPHITSVGEAAFFEAVNLYAGGGDIKRSFETGRHNTKEVELNRNHVTSLDQLLTLLDIDESVWDVDKSVVNYWGNPANANVQVKAWLKRHYRIDEDLIREVYESLPAGKELPKPKYKKRNGAGHLLQINIFDLHYGKLAWAPESGENYDSKIARQRFIGAISDFIEESENKNIERVLFPVGNDFFNSDTVHGTTTAGTPQQDDLRWQKSYQEGVRLLIDGIELLRQHVAPVDVLCVPGNHDKLKSYFATLHLDAYYRNCKTVSVDTSPAKHKGYKFGDCGIMLTHGDRIKHQELINDFVVLFPEIWAKTKFREVHCGHLHHESVKEHKGGKIRIMPSMCGTDAYHFEGGYVGSQQQAQAFIWHESQGLRQIVHHNII